jgi:hypothetical protein
VEQITTVGIDLAKNVFSVHGVDAAGKTVLRRTVPRLSACTARISVASASFWRSRSLRSRERQA